MWRSPLVLRVTISGRTPGPAVRRAATTSAAWALASGLDLVPMRKVRYRDPVPFMSVLVSVY